MKRGHDSKRRKAWTRRTEAPAITSIHDHLEWYREEDSHVYVPPHPPVTSDVRPGSAERVELLRGRVERGEGLWMDSEQNLWDGTDGDT